MGWERVRRCRILRALKALGTLWVGFDRRLGPLLSAAVAFYFLLGLIPVLFLTAAAASFFLGQNPQAFRALEHSLLGFLPPGLGREIFGQIQAAASRWKAFGAFGILSLFLVAMGLFDALDVGVNRMMDLRKHVGFLRGRLLSLLYVLGALAFFSMAGVADYLVAVISPMLPVRLWGPLGQLVSFLAFSVFLLIVYQVFPSRRPQFRKSAGVALGVSILWFVLQRFGTRITAGVLRRQAIYGILAGATIFLTWMYLLAFLILMGARILAIWNRSSASSGPR